jgi:hypothetical protein
VDTLGRYPEFDQGDLGRVLLVVIPFVALVISGAFLAAHVATDSDAPAHTARAISGSVHASPVAKRARVRGVGEGKRPEPERRERWQRAAGANASAAAVRSAGN